MLIRPLASLAALALLSASGFCFAQEPKFQSKVINRETPGHAVEIDVDVTGAKELYLVVRDGGDGFGADWADWAEPRLVTPSGEKKLTEIKWKSAGADWGNVAVGKNAGGDAMKIAGKAVEYGIGTHANSVIGFDLPAGTTRFKARGGIDNGGSGQPLGSSVQFAVYTQKPPVQVTQGSVPAGGGSREAKDAVSGLDVAEGLEALLFASEASNPAMLNPTSIDIDHLGRVWVCEVVNYRHRKGERKEGDRILILEDTNGDGVADKQTVFHQGTDVDSAHGICVLPTPSGKGTKIIVSANDNVFFLHDEDGDLKSDKKEMLFTGIAGTQHDHGIHAFHFGPDGKLYFNFGNSGNQIKDKDGKQIVDLAGNEVTAARKPYQEGMVFRCNMDGSEFETLGWNFRNNWEIAVDSFGTLWQSDNDDDGNKGVRINFVMEFGDYGYKDQMTGAGWQSPRTNMETEIPLRHWHLNDPGTVPNLLQTGAGSPTGICVYEGDLLPEIFRNQVIHCDAGPNVVRAYPVKKSGAGYTAETVNILTGARDNWFRPSDVCVAPDGSLFVADWYDPGVGGHRMGDADRGRLFRVAPPKTPYKVAKVDVSTVDGAIAALKSPNEATRYLAWNALHEMGEKAEAELAKIAKWKKPPVQRSDASDKDGPSATLRARALWLLSKLKTKGLLHVAEALQDGNPDIRITAIRAARQLVNAGAGQTPVQSNVGDQGTTITFEELMIRSQLRDVMTSTPIPMEVLRETAVALRHSKLPSKPLYWAQLATRHDGKDRWYLEALGLAAEGNWDACIAALKKLEPADAKPESAFANPVARDLIWRGRGTAEGTNTAKALAMLLASDHVSAADAPRYVRSLDFQPPSQQKDDALIQLAFGNFGDEAKTKFINTEAISRLKGFDVSKNPAQMAALNRVLDGVKGQPQFITLVEKFNVADRFPDLLALAQAKPDDQIGIDSVKLLLDKKANDLLSAALASDNDKGRSALATATALSNTGDVNASPLLLPVVKNDKAPADLRRQAIKGAARSKPGATEILKLAESKAFDDTFAPALSAALQAAPLDAAQKTLVATLFPAPAGKDSKPLPPLSELAKLKGNAGNGQKLFATTGKCATCHIVNGEGKEVGPNLSEIGAKLSRQALFESIVFPSAGISHNYEAWTIVLNNGTTQTGLLVSEDGEKLSLKGIDAIVRTIAIKDIDERQKNTISLMPADLAKLLSQEEMADVVEYLMTLKKAKK
ncbi:MAG: dehydrogenase [Planctomycetota bacterium]|nr:NPCBM/NEW2 domain-containing protein [Planctomycetales bacterium]RLS45973.1 MAG: dehydrogenase [Planctomycetota bacterium]